MLNDLRMTGVRPVINFITYWDNVNEGEESFTAVEFIGVDGSCFYKTLEQRRPDSESAESSGESMADRRIPRKRVPPNRLVEENDGNDAGKLSILSSSQAYYNAISSICVCVSKLTLGLAPLKSCIGQLVICEAIMFINKTG